MLFHARSLRRTCRRKQGHRKAYQKQNKQRSVVETEAAQGKLEDIATSSGLAALRKMVHN